MKNSARHLFQCYRTWSHLRHYAGLFSLSDALLQIHRVAFPARFNDFLANKGFKRILRITDSIKNDPHVQIHCKPLQLDFLWNGVLDNNLFFMVEQECSDLNPHCYTTFPIQINGTRHVIDVGACEGLFAFRMAKLMDQVKVHCFEPSPIMAHLLQEGARMNGVSDSVLVESDALLDQKGFVKFMASESPDAGRVIPCSHDDLGAIKSNSLDNYCDEIGLKLCSSDLIKIDAEGSDFDVLKGARHVIETCRPQIAVTTYHRDDHAESIFRWLNELDLGYSFRLKGFSFWTSKPRPVLLQASTLK